MVKLFSAIPVSSPCGVHGPLHVGSGGIRYILATLSEGCIRKVIQVSRVYEARGPSTYRGAGLPTPDIAVDFGES